MLKYVLLHACHCARSPQSALLLQCWCKPLPVCSSAHVDQQDHPSYAAEAEGSCAQQTADTESDEDSSATAQSSESSTTAESKTEHAEDIQQLQLQNHHAQLPQQVQEHGQLQHVQHTQQAQQAQQGQRTSQTSSHPLRWEQPAVGRKVQSHMWLL